MSGFGNHHAALVGRVAAVLGCLAVGASAQTSAVLPEMVVLAERGGAEGGGVRGWSAAELGEAAPRTIDELLQRQPSFSLYRRQTSMFGNPSSAGVSLRNTGATAASRTLVLLDGVPQNDPFGGWVYWARYDAAALDSIRIVPTANAAVWGNQSPAGVVQMSGRAPFRKRHVIKASGGGQGTAGASMFHQAGNAAGSRSVSISAFGLRSDGFFAVGPTQRGTIDRKLDIDLWGAEVKSAWLAAPGLTLEPEVSVYREDRGNGTPLARNSTDALDFSLRLTSDEADYSWQALAWHQRRAFESVFSSVNSGRTAETMALDQYDVPGRGTGGAFTMQWDGAGRWSFLAGADTRHLSGETNEDVGTFRRRVAGGQQDFTGLFGSAGYRPDASTEMKASARIDYWRLDDGRRSETSLVTGASLRDESQPARDGIEPSAAVAIRRRLGDDLQTWLTAGTGFRVPTLNELHRPFRVRNDIVEANPELDPERFASIEAGAEWNAGDNLTFAATAFHYRIRDAVANVPVTDAAEIAAVFGSLPSGGSGSVRRNVDAARVAGIEAEAEWRPAAQVVLDLTGIWSDTRFTRSAAQPLLEGKPFPQSPDLRVMAGAEWQLLERLAVFAGCEYGASQYDDALAQRVIADYTSVRIGARWRVGAALCQIRVENLFDEEIQTGLGSDGIRTFAAPRSAWLGVEWEF